MNLPFNSNCPSPEFAIGRYVSSKYHLFLHVYQCKFWHLFNNHPSIRNLLIITNLKLLKCNFASKIQKYPPSYQILSMFWRGTVCSQLIFSFRWSATIQYQRKSHDKIANDIPFCHYLSSLFFFSHLYSPFGKQLKLLPRGDNLRYIPVISGMNLQAILAIFLIDIAFLYHACAVFFYQEVYISNWNLD